MEVCKQSGLQPEDVFVLKVLQFQELLDVRHSVMLLGLSSQKGFPFFFSES